MHEDGLQPERISEEPRSLPGESNGNSNSAPLYVVGVGASAGGLEALERFFSNMPADSGMAFVVLQHLSPDFKSLMDELLARQTSIPIRRVEDGMSVEPNCIYLIPPKKEMIISGGKLLLTDKDPAQGLTLPIDHFFRSLAQDAGRRAVGVILSGTGSDGSRGIRSIHEAGGLAIAQTEDTAKFDGMPRSARETGVVDLVLPPEEMPAALLKYIQHPLSLGRTESPKPSPAREEGMNAVLKLLRDEYGIDFSHYKPNTVLRRVERRLFLNQFYDLDDYVEHLRRDPGELNSLYKDLLIGVTRFFRDREAFERLENLVLPSLLMQVPPDGEFRVWIAGCATGEEAYSVAILVHERIEAMKRPVNVKIFATDVHRASLDFASAGVYSDESFSEITPDRLERYFLRKGDGFHVSQTLRQMIVFAPHNIIKDAPFTKLDLITCRNLLIYLQPLAQKKALSLFHFGLKTGGVLLLGPSESPGELADEFESIDEHWKIYRKCRDVRLPPDLRLPMSPGGVQSRSVLGGYPSAASPDAQLMGVYDALLESHMPPGLLINEKNELIHAFGGAGRFLHLRDGRVSADVLDMVDSELRMVLAGALRRVWKTRTPVVYKGVRVNGPDGERHLQVTVSPVDSRHAKSLHAFVAMQDQAAPPARPAAQNEIDMGELSREQLSSLEAELRYTKENLQATIEEMEASNEELQATNEELVASNEELQSTNEELHSVNEELYTVNAEYQRKIAELTELTADMDNLLHSTDIGTIFLDENLRIRKFTPQIGRAYQLLPQDVGRRIDSFTHNIQHDTLLDDISAVLASGVTFEKEVQDRHGDWFFLRILPYRAPAGVKGVVLTLIDISTLKQAQAQLRETGQQLQGILEHSTTFIYVKDLQGRYRLVNKQCRTILGVDDARAVGRSDYDLLPQRVADEVAAHDQVVLNSGRVHEFEETLPHGDEPHTYISVKFPLRDRTGRIYAVAGVCTDISERKRAEEEAHQAVVRRDEFLAMLSHELRNPLGAILNAAYVMKQQRLDAAAAAQARETIERQGRQMTRLLDDLLDVSRVTQNKIEMRKRVLDITTLVDDAVEAARPFIDKRHIRLSVETAGEPVYVDCDPARLQQIQVNLLTNAAKYTPPGERILLKVGREDGEAVIRVRDTGVGIAPEMLDSVFDLFVQSNDTLDRSDGGMGVGLTLVRSIVEMHGGRVSAHSDGPGRGSEFVVRLPLAAKTAEEPQLQAASPVKSHTKKIVVVEDNADSRQMLRTLLELDGYTVQTAADGSAGLECIARERPDVALIDIGLPELDGYQIARRLRNNPQNDGVYLVALTGYGQPSDRQQALEAGFDEHLVKPLQPEELTRVLTERPAPL